MTHLLAHLTLLFGLIPTKILPQGTATLLAPAWSITLEWQYYLVAPLLAFAIRQTTGIFILGLIGCGDVYYSRYWDNGFLLSKLPLFLIGIGCFYLYANRAKWTDSKSNVFIILAAWAAVMLVSWHWVALGIWTLVFGCLFVEPTEADPYSRWLICLRELLLRPSLQFVGRISYPLYLVHWPVIVLLTFGLLHWRPKITATHAVILMLCAGLPTILLTAFLLHKFVEAPLMKFGKKFDRASKKRG
jgi:peptidoglycan/LPS O-acetylase OafA/YrhL